MDMFSPYIREKVLTEIVMEVCQFPNMTELILEMADEDAQELYHHNEDDTTMFDQALTGEPMMQFEWYDEHSVIPDGGWTITHEEDMSPP